MDIAQKHYEKLDSKDLSDKAMTEIKKLKVNDVAILIVSVYKKLINIKSKIYNISIKVNDYNKIKYNCSLFTNDNNEFIINQNKQFIKNNILSYYELVKFYKRDISYNIIKYTKNTNKNLLRENIINLLKYKQLKYEYKFIKRFIIDKMYTRNHYDNSEYIYQKILENEHISDILFDIELEKTFIINDRNFRADLFIELNLPFIDVNDNIKFEHMKIIIETDEKHHFIKDDESEYIINDKIKDLYWVQNGYSIIRVDLKNKKINDEIINIVINYIFEIIESKRPLYIFSDEYIECHKHLKGSTIILPQHLKDSIKEPIELIKSQYSNNTNQSIITPDKISFGSSNKTPKKKLKETNSIETDISSDKNIIELQRITIGSNKKKISKNKQL